MDIVTPGPATLHLANDPAVADLIMLAVPSIAAIKVETPFS